ncbi:DNA primase [Candidatus Woesearchaeota archaeon]|nr:DNA primase [Candidatus Woesearchaeota archaeon]
MGKISPMSSKYIVNASIEIEGVVDRPDVIGAIFGQTEGLLGSELELRELQRSGRIGRIEVNVDIRSGKTAGTIVIPSSLDKAETSIIAASLEIIQRIGPCNAKLKVLNIEDVRVSKRSFVVERAKELLKTLMDQVMPDSQELAEEVAHSIRAMEICEYGRDRLPAGPSIDDSEEIIVVEGRADVLNLLKNGFKNVIAINGTSCPPTIVDLCRKKEVTVFVDGDRGGDLIIKELSGVTEIDFVVKAPDGKEVEELTKKEIHKALRSKVAIEQAKLEMGDTSESIRKPMFQKRPLPTTQQPQSTTARPTTPQSQPTTTTKLQQPIKSAPVTSRPTSAPTSAAPQKPAGKQQATGQEKEKFSTLLESLIGTKGAVLLDDKLNVLGKVPLSELNTTLTSLKGSVYAVVMDGSVDQELASIAEKSGVKHLAAMDSKVKDMNVDVLTAAEV